MDYDFRKIEQAWQEKWKATQAYKTTNDTTKPKCYVLDMFPYPSGAGLHVGHPLGYISSDIYSRYKRLKGFNVLHPMGYDAFGLPAEQYAIEKGVHPAVSTEENIANFRKQLDNIGFSYDWDREVRTSEASYYKWTQWIFLQLFHSFFNRIDNRAEHLSVLIESFENEGSLVHEIPNTKYEIRETGKNSFTAEEWNGFDEKTKHDILMEYRLAFCGYGEVNWCEALGTVLANDEVVNGVSERGGYPVEKKRLRQWYLRITEYADRLLKGLETVDFSEAMKEMQSNWIGKSYGAEIEFNLTPGPSPQVARGASVQVSSQSENPGSKNSVVPKYSIVSIKQFELARENRKGHTEAEAILWKELRGNNLGEKFRRQHPIDAYIVDFVSLQNKLIIEIDGGYHETEDQKIYDDARSSVLNQIGFKVIRFTNEEVINHTKETIKRIKEALAEEQQEATNIHEPAIGKQSASFTEAPLATSGEGTGVRSLVVYTTRPDTIFGVDFMVIAPELDWIPSIVSEAQKEEVENYIAYVKSRSERERQAEKKISGCFTGAYAINPFNGKEIPIWISEYVLAGYGTGAIMAVPCGDDRDFKFAQHFNIPITNILGDAFNGNEANPTKDAKLTNSGFLDGVVMRDAIQIVNAKLEEMGIGKAKVNYRMRDAAFSRQRYWGEPFPIVWKNGIAYALDESELPLELPKVDGYGPGPDGEGPLANILEWTAQNLETNTMPGYAGSSWYFLRYMDPHNDQVFCDRKASDYWNQVDIYIGGTEHAVGHLLYSRLWTKVLYDLGFIGFDEPFKKLVNQGMIQGSSRFVYRIVGTNQFVSAGKKNEYNVTPLHVDVNLVDGYELDIEAFKKWKPEFADAEFVFEDGTLSFSCTIGTAKDMKYICGSEVEKMSKRYYNTVNPNDICEKYGADTFRMYEMFLGPVEASKPWETKGIEGVHRFLKKLWRLFFTDTTFSNGKAVQGKPVWNDQPATPQELKVLHKTIRKIDDDTEKFSYNTAVSAFMVCVNELTDLKCNKKSVLEQLLVLLSPYAPHVTEELWHQLGNTTSILDAAYPVFEQKYVVESSKEYPVSINGKLRTTMDFALDAMEADVKSEVLTNEIVQKWLEGKEPKKIVFVKGKMINVVV